MKTTSSVPQYTEKELKRKNLNVLDAIAEEMGIIWQEECGADAPKKDLVIATILRKQQQLALEAEGLTDLNPPMHRELSKTQELAFRKWARENYDISAPIDPTWHPVVQEECREMNSMHAAGNLKPRAQARSKKDKDAWRLPAEMDNVPSAGTASTPPTIKTVAELQEKEEFCFENNKKVFQCIKRYKDEKGRDHIVVKTDQPAKNQPAQMDLYYTNHLAMTVLT